MSREPTYSRTHNATPPGRDTSAPPAPAGFFLPYQLAWINDEAELKLCMKSRRVGFTFATSYRAVRKCMTRPKGFQQWVTSRDRLTAEEFIRDYVRQWCDKLNIAARCLFGEEAVAVDPDRSITAFTAVFPTGNRIVSLSSTPEVFAGKGGDVIIDEADLHEDAGRVIDMAMPAKVWGGQIEILSALRVDGSAGTPFCQLFSDEAKTHSRSASLHRVTIEDAVAQGLAEKISQTKAAKAGKPWEPPADPAAFRRAFTASLRAGCRTSSAWLSQYMCQPDSGDGRLISYAQYAPCETEAEAARAVIAANPGAPRYAGFDIARHRHLSVCIEYVRVGAVLWLDPDTIAKLPGMEFDAQENWLRMRLDDTARPLTRLAGDATGMGMMIFERLHKRYPGRVDPVTLSPSRRAQLMLEYADRFTTARSVRHPRLPWLAEDMTAPRRDTASNGGLRVELPEYKTADGGISHCDFFMAGLLAASAAGSGRASFRPVTFDSPSPPETPADAAWRQETL